MALRRASRSNSRTTTGITSGKMGNWDDVIKYFADAGIEVKKKVDQAQWQICKKLRKIVRDHLIAQDLQWEPLAKRTVARKKKNKNLILIDTELYLNSISLWREKGVVKVGIKKGVTYKRKSGSINLDRVALWMENGAGKSPARPLWGPSIEELGGKAGIRTFVADAVYRRLKWLARGKPIQITSKQINKMVK